MPDQRERHADPREVEEPQPGIRHGLDAAGCCTIRFVLVPISVHMPARITMWFIGSSSFEIE